MFAFRFSVYAWLLMLNAVASVGVAYLAYRRREKRTARLLVWISVAVAWWSFTYALHVAGDNFETKYVFDIVKYFGVLWVPPLWFLLAHAYTQFPNTLSPTKQALVLASTLIFLPFVLLDPKFHTWWVWQSAVRLSNGLLVTQYAHSLFYFVYVAVGFFWILAGLWLYVRRYFDSPAHRSQLIWLILAGLFPFLGNLLTQTGLSPLPWGLDPFLLTLSLAFIAIAILRERFLDTLPIAHRLVIQQLPHGVIVIDSARRVVDLNPAAMAFCHDLPPKPRRQPLEEVIGDETLRRHLLFALYQDVSDPLEITHFGKVFNVRVSPIMVGEDDLGRIILLEDITARKRLEEDLAKARDMAVVASALKSRLLASATRDMRRPIGLMLGSLESLAQGAYGPLSDSQKQVLYRALEYGSETLGFLNNLMDYAEIESGSLMLQTQPFAPSALIDGVRQSVELIAEMKQLEFVWEIDPELPETIHGDLEWLRHVLKNLLSNAIAHTPAGSITTRLYRVDDARWAIEVRDTGKGFTRHQQNTLFDLENPQGFGLIVARGIVERMGGELRFTSTFGKGSTFTAILPLNGVEVGKD